MPANARSNKRMNDSVTTKEIDDKKDEQNNRNKNYSSTL